MAASTHSVVSAYDLYFLRDGATLRTEAPRQYIRWNDRDVYTDSDGWLRTLDDYFSADRELARIGATELRPTPFWLLPDGCAYSRSFELNDAIYRKELGKPWSRIRQKPTYTLMCTPDAEQPWRLRFPSGAEYPTTATKDGLRLRFGQSDFTLRESQIFAGRAVTVGDHSTTEYSLESGIVVFNAEQGQFKDDDW